MRGLLVVAFASAGGAVVAGLRPWTSPARRRVAELAPRPARRFGGAAGRVRALATMVGRTVRRVAHRPADTAADRRTGYAVVLGGVLAVVHPVLGIVAAGVPAAHRLWATRRSRGRAEAELLREVPDVVDLFRIAAGAGLTVHHAIEAVQTVIDGRVERALAEVRRRVAFGDRLTVALPELTTELGEPIRPLVAALVSAERDGAPLVEPLERVAWIARDVRRRRAEETARRVPVRLLFPLVACVLPAFALLTVVPLLAGTLRTLSL